MIISQTERRLIRGAVALGCLEVLRQETGMPRLGQQLEEAVVELELRDLALVEAIQQVDERVAEIRRGV